MSQFPSPSCFLNFWSLDPDVAFLNHGSFGACPVSVLAEQQRWREQMEQQPLKFLGQEIEWLLDEARAHLSDFVNCQPEDLAFVSNTTTGINAVLRSLVWNSGNEILTTNQEYNACRNALDYVAEREGLTVVVAEVPFPIASSEQVIEAVMQKVSSNTRLVLVDHITSQTGLIFPIAELIHLLTERGIETLVDGAHAPGMVPLNLQELGATYYTGNCHKWLCAPKGAGFLYVQRDRQSMIRPLTISHGANSPRSDRSRFLLEFDWMGTDDPTAYLCVPSAIQFMGALLPGGWDDLRLQNQTLAIAGRDLLCEALKVQPPAPTEMIGSLAVVPLPDGESQPLHDLLLERYRIEVPIIPWGHSGGRQIRISAQIYNSIEQYEYLATVLQEVL